jgi:hypothetical protein
MLRSSTGAIVVVLAGMLLGAGTRASVLEFDRAVEVEEVEILAEPGTIRLGSGVLVPAAAPGGRVFELVFVGEGIFEFTPPNAVETERLELFTTEASLKEPFGRAILAFGNSAAATGLLAEEPPARPAAAVRRGASELFEQWESQGGRGSFGADGALYAAALGDPARAQYLGAWLDSRNLGSVFFAVDPSEAEPVALGRLELVEVEEEPAADDEDEDDDEARGETRSEVRATELWVSAGPDAAGLTGVAPPAEPAHYTIDVTVLPEEESIEGAARVDLVVGRSGARVLPMRLHAPLQVSSITDDHGRQLEWLRSGLDLHVALAEPTIEGLSFFVNVHYSGKLFRTLKRWLGATSFSGTYVLQDTRNWYPHAGNVDRATYDVTFRWPEKFRLFSTGRTVDSGREGDRIWEQRALDVPCDAFTFQVGEFHVSEEHVGHLDVTIAYNKFLGAVRTEVEQNLLQATKAALLFYESAFGWLDVDEIALVVMPRGRFQELPPDPNLPLPELLHPVAANVKIDAGWPARRLVAAPKAHLGLMTLPGDLVLERDFVPANFLAEELRPMQEIRIEALAHEIAHQWWGNKVGWQSYRDQWLSEALADFSAVQFMSRISKGKPVYLTGHARRWRRALKQQTPSGRTFESLGPVVLGSRLATRESEAAYRAVVYDKGSVVLGMLARQFGEPEMLKMLRSVVGQVFYGTIDTETFIAQLEGLSGQSLEGFAKEFIYATGVPEFYYTYDVRRADASEWVIEGRVERMADAQYRFAVAKGEGTGWHLVRKKVRKQEVAPSTLVVPFQILTSDYFPGSESQPGRGGKLEIAASITEFAIPLDVEPAELWFDARGEVLAYFYDERRYPKRVLRLRADRLAAREEREGAKATYLRALEAPLTTGGPGLGLADEDLIREARLQDVRIRLDLARLHLEEGSPDLAEKQLREAEAALSDAPDFERRQREVLQGRLELQRENYASAYARLDKYLRVDESGFDRWLARARHQWLAEDTEAFALYAIAAFETGRLDQARQAAAKAEERGADMTGLEVLLP